MTATEIVEQVTAAGGLLTLTGDGARIRAELPEEAMGLVEVLRAHRQDVIKLLRARRCYIHGDRASWWNRADGSPVCGLCHPDPFALAVQRARSAEPPAMPPGVRLVHWEPKPAPVILTYYAVVTDVSRFISMTLLELKAALAGKRWQSGHWSVRELVDRLEQCGVVVALDEKGKQP